ncbi:MAG: DNA polymerase III subunit alpha, partial [Bdellovibrionales bacterium]|nr:DNA polymerase III subunit alpha [Bdellovibrionales bacterium]
LKTLTVIQQASDFIRRDLDPDFDIEAINLREPEIYQYISGGNTIGVFQLESAGMIELCQRIGPESLDDVTAINALYRPGPLESGMVDDFIDIKHGRKEMTFPFPELEPVLKDTYGVIVYQEQVMNIARIVAGYSLGQADMLRKAMGKKKISEMDRHREIFLKGAKERNFDVDRAASLYELMANFAAYGFNKSHAVAYALIAYQTAYLKFHYPAPFYAGLLSCELSNTDKVKIYISDAKQCGVEVLPPDINQSIWLFNVVDSDIRFGMGAIKNVGSGAVEEIIRVREGKNGPYQGLIDFCQRVPYQSVNRRAMESMIKVGVFDQCEEMNRRTMLEHLELILAYGRKTQEEALSGQSSLFDMVESQDMIQPKAQLGIVDLEEFEQNQILAYEAELMGIYVSGHPLERFVKVIEQLSSMDIAAAMELPGHNKREMVLAGLISSMKITMTRKGDQMAFAVLEDLSSKIEMVIFPKVFEQYREMLETDEPVVVVGTVNLQEDPRKLFPERIQLLSEQTEERVCAVRLELEMADLSNRKLERLKEVILSYRGTVPIQLVFDNGVGRARMPLTSEYLISATPQMAARVNELLQRDAVKFIVDSSGARECG